MWRLIRFTFYAIAGVVLGGLFFEAATLPTFSTLRDQNPATTSMIETRDREARNNGAPSTLFLNKDGGNVSMAAGGGGGNFGIGTANPIATILSAALMLEWLDHPETVKAAQRIHRAVEGVLANPANRTPDLGGKLTTTQMADKIIKAL